MERGVNQTASSDGPTNTANQQHIPQTMKEIQELEASEAESNNRRSVAEMMDAIAHWRTVPGFRCYLVLPELHPKCHPEKISLEEMKQTTDMEEHRDVYELIQGETMLRFPSMNVSEEQDRTIKVKGYDGRMRVIGTIGVDVLEMGFVGVLEPLDVAPSMPEVQSNMAWVEQLSQVLMSSV